MMNRLNIDFSWALIVGRLESTMKDDDTQNTVRQNVKSILSPLVNQMLLVTRVKVMVKTSEQQSGTIQQKAERW